MKSRALNFRGQRRLGLFCILQKKFKNFTLIGESSKVSPIWHFLPRNAPTDEHSGGDILFSPSFSIDENLNKRCTKCSVGVRETKSN